MHWLGNEMTSDGNELLPTAMVLLGFGKHWNSEDAKRDEMRLLSGAVRCIRKAKKPGAANRNWIAEMRDAPDERGKARA